VSKIENGNDLNQTTGRFCSGTFFFGQPLQGLAKRPGRGLIAVLAPQVGSSSGARKDIEKRPELTARRQGQSLLMCRQ
jgi:hypothetical protein